MASSLGVPAIRVKILSYSGRRAHTLAGSVTFQVVPPTSGSDDDEFPAWGIALCVVLPVLCSCAIAAAVFFISQQKKDPAPEVAEIDKNDPAAGGEMATTKQ